MLFEVLRTPTFVSAGAATNEMKQEIHSFDRVLFLLSLTNDPLTAEGTLPKEGAPR